MKKLKILLFICCAFTIGAQGQSTPPHKDDAMSEEVKAQINKDVWAPFQKSYSNLDSELFMSIQSKEIVRVEMDNNKLLHYAQYRAWNERFFDMVRKRDAEIKIEFSFTHRMYMGTTAFEAGYYCFKSKHKGDADFAIRGYGAFQVTLKKEAGKWRIVSDADHSTSIERATFEAAEVLN